MEISSSFISNITDKVKRNKRVRRKLPGGGKISIERKLPFLILYRFREKPTEERIHQLVLTGSSYLIAPGKDEYYEDIKFLLNSLLAFYTSEFKSFLILEIWSETAGEDAAFHIRCPENSGQSTVNILEENLRKMVGLREDVEVSKECTSNRHPPHFPPFFAPQELKKKEVLLIGLGIPPIYKDTSQNLIYPVFFRHFRRQFAEVLQKAVYDFIRVQTSFDVAHYQELGRSQIDSSVWHIDRELARVEKQFQFLLLVAPINSDQQWKEFQASHCENIPEFRYRLLPLDPDILKRKLYNLNINRIHDPSLAYLFHDKREELEIQLSMLGRRNSSDFLYNSLRLYKGVDRELLQLARQILSEVPPSHPDEKEDNKLLDGLQFADKARQEYHYYQQIFPRFDTEIQVRKDIPGLMVSRGNLLLPEKMSVKEKRVSALLHHEVGTHVLTFVNGREQPLEQLRYGLADYDELQEGLAVLSEYLGGEIDRQRMRLLASRVIAANSLLDGADFVETYRLLTLDFGVDTEDAWDISTRIYQSGGFIKDIIYLRGLIRLMKHLQDGGELEPLFAGKIAEKHIPVIKELQSRKVLKEVSVLPRYLNEPRARQRLQKVKEGLKVTQLLN